MKIEDLKKSPKKRAKFYFETIYDLLHEIEELDRDNELLKKVHGNMMMLPEYWEVE